MKLPPAEVIERHVLSLPPVADGCERIAREVQREAVALAYERAHDKGEFAAGIRVEPSFGAGARVVATDRKSTWLEEGTGIYGPRRTPIRPKRAKFLVFRVDREWQGGGSPTEGFGLTKTQGRLIFAKQVRGREASWIMRDAAKVVAARHGLRFRNLRRFQG